VVLFIPFGIEISILFMDEKTSPRDCEIGGFKTVKDLVLGIKADLDMEKPG